MHTTIRIDKRIIGEGHPAFIIAEIGSNHDGTLDRALELIEAARGAGADAVKFQSFTAEGLLNPLRLENDRWVPHPAYHVLESLELPEAWHRELKEFADSRDLVFLSAPFDAQRAALLNDIGVSAFKVASGDLTNGPLLEQIGGYGKPVIISTGAAYTEEVAEAIEVLGHAGCYEVGVLHCVSLYPPRFEEANIRAMKSLAGTFAVPVGYSDHTPGWTVPLGAVALGASIIEKHITFDRTLKGPDHSYALEVGEFASMVIEIRNLEAALGDGEKRPAEREIEERVGARRSIYASVEIGKGTVVESDMLKLVRHAYGFVPKDLDSIVGKRAGRDIKPHSLIRPEDIEG